MTGKLFTVDLTGVKTEENIHERIAEALGLPEWYGKNMDALHDCLTAVSGRIIFRGTGEAKKNLPEVYKLLRRVCIDSGMQNPEVWVYFVESED